MRHNRVSARAAFWFGLALSAAGGMLLAASVDALSAWLAIGTLLGYLLVYTPLKKGKHRCARCWPPFPHFLAIALMYREDHAGAGFRMLPRFDADGSFTKREIVVFTVVLVIVTMLPWAGRSGAIYSLIMFTARAFFAYQTARLAPSDSRMLARRVLHASVLYLPVVLGTMMAWKA